MIDLLLRTYDSASQKLTCSSGEVLPLLARLSFASTLFLFFWRSAMTKFGEGFTGLFLPSDGAYYQILPARYEAAGFDSQALGFFDWLVVFTGTWAEVLLPLMIVFGLWTRLAALGMIGFIVVMSIVDVSYHGVAAGQMFDGLPTGLILDQRLFWGLTLFILLALGGGFLSIDKFLLRFRA